LPNQGNQGNQEFIREIKKKSRNFAKFWKIKILDFNEV